MHDIVIRGGTIIDGFDNAAFTGDVAIVGGRIAAVGSRRGCAPAAMNRPCTRRSNPPATTAVGSLAPR
jgi:adenine deaminase